ncbi:MAG: NAD(P)H-hydrate dehydratase [Saprospiraceae bacterium]|nr:NAD(P)H-hydrate dehydratase [Saprospiraceae bacterium]
MLKLAGAIFFYMEIFSANQIRALDAYTIAHEPITSIDLMERASLAFTNWFIEQNPDEDIPVCIFCGPGNNGGDGLAVARLLHDRFYTVSVIFCAIGPNATQDNKINAQRLPDSIKSSQIVLKKEDPFPPLKHGWIVIDAIFGSGLSRPVEGYWGNLVEYINGLENTVVSIDIPSGLFADQHSSGSIIMADQTLSFELPKLAFLLPENQNYVGEWHTRSIGLSNHYIQNEKTSFFFTTQQDVKLLLKPAKKFDHKGTYGHALLIMGSYGKIGAAVLAAKACLRTGCGLVTVHLPKCGYAIMQISAPEVMASIDDKEHYFSQAPAMEKFSAVGMGCGLDTKDITKKGLHQVIQTARKPLLLDADALNILAENKAWLRELPPNSILTPHPGEFKRLFGATADDFEQNKLQRQLAQDLKVIIILKGAHTCIASPDGNCYFNSTGNPGMATAGSGDVLSGMITSLLAQGYDPLQASILGVYLHGLAGDLASQQHGMKSMIAGDIIEYIGKAYEILNN